MITIYISDARDEYARTVFEKVGLPTGTRVKVRYSIKRIHPTLRPGIDNNSLIGRSVAICYMSGNRGDLSSAKALACRYARVAKSERISDFASIECELLGFPATPTVSDLLRSVDSQGLLDPGPRLGFFVIDADRVTDEILTETSGDRWGEIVRELTSCSFFRDASFLYWEGFTNSHGRGLVCPQGAFRVSAGSIVTAQVHTYGVTRESRLHEYEILVDTTAIESIDGEQVAVAFGREFFELRFAMLPSERFRATRIRVAPGSGENGSFFAVPIEILTRKLSSAVKRTSIAVSGAAAATAGILPAGAPISLRIGLIVAGSIGLGLSTRPSS